MCVLDLSMDVLDVLRIARKLLKKCSRFLDRFKFLLKDGLSCEKGKLDYTICLCCCRNPYQQVSKASTKSAPAPTNASRPALIARPQLAIISSTIKS